MLLEMHKDHFILYLVVVALVAFILGFITAYVIAWIQVMAFVLSSIGVGYG